MKEWKMVNKQNTTSMHQPHLINHVADNKDIAAGIHYTMNIPTLLHRFIRLLSSMDAT